MKNKPDLGQAVKNYWRKTVKFLNRKGVTPTELATTNLILNEKEMEQFYGQQINQTISPKDEMYNSDMRHYLRVAYSGLRSINLSLLVAGAPIPNSILDIPCGHGRMLRLLKVAFPQGEFTVADLDRDAVDFCAANFDAKAVYSSPEPAQINLSRTFDLLWCGSLLTHLRADRWLNFLEFFCARLNPGGVAVFTTHGLVTADWLSTKHYLYGLQPVVAEQLLTEYEATGFGYADYGAEGGYGVSLSSTAWVCEQLAKVAGWQLVAYFPKAWDDHQDVWACQRI